MELIKREAAKAKIAEIILGVSDFANDMRQTCYDAIDAAPTIDAVPVVHGRWIHPEGAQSETRACSICDNQVTMDFDTTTRKPLFKGCPYCFARMDGEEAQQCGAK